MFKIDIVESGTDKLTPLPPWIYDFNFNNVILTLKSEHADIDYDIILGIKAVPLISHL
jgi:hypothetical protein